MKVVVFHNVDDTRLDNVPHLSLQAPTDAIVRIITSVVCGTDLHFICASLLDIQVSTTSPS
ncbi:hypothetical protein EWW49_25995 [Pseudomonas syringae]|uniref:hypothetical protein n=1 Tax=Pseudomonas sp. MWU16-30316 TaxID=2878093 RepID=UPI001102E64D|nr:hypothetical protein [Pseudomonas sp. MWU16-30316]TFZ34281.1 hypothetical protein EWW49_25995 [Pseudomonas syringae]